MSIFFNPMFAEACAYIGTPLLCNLSVVPAGSANTGLEQCIGQKSVSEEALRNSGFKPNLDRSNLGHKNNLLVLLCAMGDGVLRCLVPFFNKLRKTKRQRLEECLEWDEANASGEVPDQKLEWSMVDPEGDGSLFYTPPPNKLYPTCAHALEALEQSKLS